MQIDNLENEVNKAIDWIYQIRAFGIFAVVVCHMQGILHSSEWVQMFTLYSVTSLVFLMGCTKYLSLNKSFSVLGDAQLCVPDSASELAIRNIVKSICKVMPEYVIVCIVNLGGLSDWNTLFTEVLTFDGPTYFIKHFIVLTIIAPLLYMIIIFISRSAKSDLVRLGLYGVFVVTLFVVGYASISICDFYVQSYLAVYGAGMAFMAIKNKKEPQIVDKSRIKHNKMIKGIIALTVLLFGTYEVHSFYFARVGGDHNYSGGIDAFTSKLQMNPPNLSVILYSFGCIAVFYIIFSEVNYVKSIPIVSFFDRILVAVGRYSLDVFLWHLVVLHKICIPFWNMSGMNNIWAKRVLFYIMLLGIPIMGRLIVNSFKNCFDELLGSSKA